MASDAMWFVLSFPVLLGLIIALRWVGLNRDRFATRSAGWPSHAPEIAHDPDRAAARLNRISAARAQIHVAPPPPPPPPSPMDDTIERSRGQAILFRQHLPPRRDALSHWGGLPLLPQATPWPRFTTPEGVERPLSFLLQLDCGAVPERGRLDGLPDRGLLLFFLDLDWGRYWQWRVIHVDADLAGLAPADPPADLPKLYGERGCWPWAQRDEDWPTVLPRFSFDPVLIEGRDLPPPADEDEAEERKLWPGTIDVEAALAALDGGIAESRYFQNKYDAGALVRPYANFPHDWSAVKIALGHFARQLGRGHLSRDVARGDMTQDEARAIEADAQRAIEKWMERAVVQNPFAPLAPADSNAAWQLLRDHQSIASFGLRDTVNDAIEATLAGNADPLAVLPPAAVEMVRHRHALASRGEHGVHINTPDRMLAAPSCPQAEAFERVQDDWLLLFEMSGNDGIGHHFGEGVYQFWIRPDDLAQRRFDRVQLTAEAY